MNDTLVIVDGYSSLFRFYYGNNIKMKNKNGIMNNAIYLFVEQLNKLINTVNLTHIVVAFDTGNKTYRNELYSEYKINRPKCDPELIEQFPIARDAVKAFNIKSIEVNGYEADDVIATLVDKAILADFKHINIISSDKDLMQLLTKDSICLYDSKKKKYYRNRKIDIIDKLKVDIRQDQIIDFQALMGDKADNIPGIPGIGPKTAEMLLKKYDNIENIINFVDKIENESIKKKIKNGIEDLYLSKKLVTLNKNVPINETFEDLKYKSYNKDTLMNFLREQKFFQFLNSISNTLF